MELFFYVLSRKSQPHRTFYAKGALYGQGVPIENIVIHYGPECTDYDSLDEMNSAFLDAFPDSHCRHGSLHNLGCFWGSLACIESFLLSEHSYCYFVQDDFVPVANAITETPIADIISNFEKLRAYDPNFQIWIHNYGRHHHYPVPDKSAQIREDITIHKGLFDYGDQGLILDKEGAAYMVNQLKYTNARDPEDLLKSLVGTPVGDSFYISMDTNHTEYMMPEEWSEVYP